LNYQWFLDGAPVGSNNPTYSYTSVLGNHTIYVNLTDSAGPPIWIISNLASVTVNSALIAPTLTASKGNIDQGQVPILNSATVSTGTSPYSYQWYSMPPGASSYLAISGANSSSYSFVSTNSTAVGVWSFKLNVTDSATIPITVTSTNVSVTVNVVPTVSISPVTSTLDVGQSQLLTTRPTGGSGNYTAYQWYVNSSAQTGQNGAMLNFSATAPGSYLITVTVTDSLGWTSSLSNASVIVVNPALVAPTPNATSLTIDQTGTSTLTITVTTGTPSFSYQWFVKAPSAASYSVVNGSTSSNYNFATSLSTATGSWSFLVQVTDATGSSINSTATAVLVMVYPFVFVSPGFASLNVGQSQQFIATPSGGSGNYTSYQWYVNGVAQAGKTESVFNYSPASAGNNTVSATVTDSIGGTSSQSNAALVTASVLPTPTPLLPPTPTPIPSLMPTPSPTSTSTLTASLSESASSLYLGNTVNFTSSTDGGSPPYTYAWFIDGQSTANGTSPYFSIEVLSAGAHHVYVQVKDAQNSSATTNTVEFNVLPASSPSPSPSVPETPALFVSVIAVAVLLVAFSVKKKSLFRL
jgi:hypothetical protein